jgi:hypothetical protein
MKGISYSYKHYVYHRAYKNILLMVHYIFPNSSGLGQLASISKELLKIKNMSMVLKS